jgi:hypothetical protein
VRAELRPGGRLLFGWFDRYALAAVQAEIFQGGLGKAVPVLRAAHVAGRRVFLAAGVHPDELGALFLHGIVTSSGGSLL